VTNGVVQAQAPCFCKGAKWQTELISKYANQ